jgi:hypothetical protein
VEAKALFVTHRLNGTRMNIDATNQREFILVRENPPHPRSIEKKFLNPFHFIWIMDNYSGEN